MKIEEPFLIDTNILIYALNKDSAYYDFSRKIISENGENLYLAYKSVGEFICVMSKMGRYDIIELEWDKIIRRFNILFSDSFSAEIYKKLILKYQPVGNHVYDFEIVSVMLNSGIRKIATVNLSDFIKIEEIDIIHF